MEHEGTRGNRKKFDDATSQNGGWNRNSKAAGQTSTNNLSSVDDLLVEHRIKLDAPEDVLKETNPLLTSFTSARSKICEPRRSGIEKSTYCKAQSKLREG